MAKIKKAFLVYQGAISNVFEVKAFNLSPFGREAKRLVQHSDTFCVAFAKGLAVNGTVVRTAVCIGHGDCAEKPWSEDFTVHPLGGGLENLKLN